MIKNLTIIEIASVLAGPSVGMFFAELGAKVIKVEAPNGDVTRGWKLANEDKNSSVSAYFSSINYNKEYLRLDLKSAEGKRKLRELLLTADVVITNNPEQQAKALGVNKEAIRLINPNIIHGHIKGFAQSTRLAYDVVLQAETGYLSMTGNGDSIAKLPIAMIDVLAGHQLKEGLLVALFEHRANGAYVEVSLEEAALAGLINQASNYLMERHVPKPMGTQHPNIAPYGDIFTTQDKKQLLVACGSEAHFQKLCKALDQTSLATDERFANNASRLANRNALVSVLQLAMENMQGDAFLEQMHVLGIPAAEVKSVDTVLNGEVAQSMILEEEIDNIATKRIKGNAFSITPA